MSHPEEPLSISLPLSPYRSLSVVVGKVFKHVRTVGQRDDDGAESFTLKWTHISRQAC